MKGKLKPFLMISSIIVFTAVTSFFIGRQVEQRKTVLSENVATTKEESTEIAVVNQDSGTNYKDKNVSYSSDLVKSLDSSFVLTDRDAAKNGLKDGKYGAMVIIPGKFSENVTSVNDVTPSKVEIYYETNSDLSDENKLIVAAKISDFEKKLNNKLSYIYIKSVFDEVHNGQDYVSDVLKNDDIDSDALNSINDADILESINLTQLQNENIDIKDLDLNKNFEENKNIMDQVDKSYRQRLLDRERKFDKVKEELLKITGNDSDGMKSYRNKIQNMTPEQLKQVLSKKHNYNYDVLSTNNNTNVDEVNKYIENLTKDGGGLDNLVSTYNENVLLKIDEKGQSAIKQSNDTLNKSKETADSTLDTIQNSSIKELNNLRSNLVNGVSNPKVNSVNEEYLLYAQIVNELRNTNPEMLDNIYKDIVDQNKVDYTKILKNPTAGVTPDNTFSSWNDLKAYMFTNVPAEQKNTFELERSALYKGIDVNDTSLNNNITLIDNVTEELNGVTGKLKDTSNSTGDVIKNSDYEYISNVFAPKSKDPLSKRIDLNDSLIKDIKENLSGNTQKTLISTMKSNNTKNVDNVRDKVQYVVEKTISDDDPIDVDSLLKVFDDKYMSKFDNLVKKVDEIDRTSETVDGDSDIEKLWKSYDKNNEELNKSVTKQISEYEKAVDSYQDQTNKNIDTMQDDLEKGIEASQNKLSSTLKGAKETKQNTSNSNQQKLGSLQKVLSNSRVGTVENTDMYNFIISPVSAIKTENLLAKAPEKIVTNNYNKDTPIIIFSLICFSIVGFTTLAVYGKKRLIK